MDRRNHSANELPRLRLMKRKPSEDPPGLPRDSLVLAALEDAEGTVRATDTKASIALVAHGFIFAGILGVLSRLGGSFEQAGCSFRVAVVALTSITTMAFLASVVQILRCVRPAPASIIPDVPSHDVFYIPKTVGAIRGMPSNSPTFAEVRATLREMTASGISDELLAELVKVSAIRSRKVSLASSGLALLGIEVGLAVALLAVLGVHGI